MKRYVAYIFAVLSLAWMVSCSVDEGLTNPNEAGRVALQFQSSSMTRSAGDDALNENKLVSLDCYFYPTNGTDTDAKWHYRVELKDGAERLDTQTPGVYTIENELMPTGEMSNVFGSGANGSGMLYVIANYPNDDLPNAENLTDSSIDDLKQKVVTTVWSQGANWQAQSSFVMDGQATVNKSGTNITGTVQLIRSAAKIELAISSVEASAKNGDKVYVPALGENGEKIGLTMHQAATKSQIANDWKNSALTYNADATSHISLAGYTFKKGTGTAYTQVYPFYSYPTHWGAGPSGEAYLLLVVPWQEVETNDDGSIKTDNGVAIPKEGTKPQSCYYEIPIGKLSDGNVISEHIERNRHYQISINIGTLGSFVEEKPVTLEPSYMVVDWTSGDIEAQIKDQRYLVVDKNMVRVDNKDVCTVAYNSSHDVVAEIESIVFYDLTGNTAEEQTITNFTTSVNGNETTYRFTYGGRTYTFVLSAVNGELSVTHVLQNNKDLDDFDYVPYTINVNIHHSEEDYADTFNTDVTFEQYPAMYITAYQNPDYEDGDDDNEHYGYMFVNSYNNGNDNSSGGSSYPSAYVRFGSSNNYSYVQYLGSANGLTSTTNANPNSYLLTVSSFTDNTYVIGDPRTQDVDATLRDATFTPNNQSGARTIWRSAPALDGTTRTLTYPYPTRATADTKNMIAPQIRIASSYSVLGADFVTQKEIARRRCASYQEAGYPAGRWRLPTKAEAEYMVKLSAEGLIPKLYSSGYEYWCAHGYFTPYNTASGNHAAGDVVYVESDTNEGASVRCVYDVWYWGDERISNISTFTWGDMPRNN